MFEVTIRERPYTHGTWKNNVLKMDDTSFGMFMSMVNISKDNMIDWEGQGIKDTFYQYTLSFNSSLRHTACLVLKIENDGKAIYVRDDSQYQEECPICTKEMQNYIKTNKASHSSKKAA